MSTRKGLVRPAFPHDHSARTAPKRTATAPNRHGQQPVSGLPRSLIHFWGHCEVTLCPLPDSLHPTFSSSRPPPSSHTQASKDPAQLADPKLDPELEHCRAVLPPTGSSPSILSATSHHGQDLLSPCLPPTLSAHPTSPECSGTGQAQASWGPCAPAKISLRPVPASLQLCSKAPSGMSPRPMPHPAHQGNARLGGKPAQLLWCSGVV